MATTTNGESAVKGVSEATHNGSQAVQPRSDTPYPFFPIQEGIKFGEAVQKAGGSSATDAEVSSQLGLSSVQSRGWTYRLSSAREFGIIERTGRGDNARIQVTNLFMAYAHPGNEHEKRAALMQMVTKPSLYVALLTRYRGAPKPEAAGLANVLWREHGILESVKLDAAKAFLASIEFAGLVTNGVIHSAPAMGTSPTPPGGVAIVDEAQGLDTKEVKGLVDALPAAPQGTQHVAVPADFIIYPCKIGKGRIIKIPLPPEITKSEVERMYALLLTQIDED